MGWLRTRGRSILAFLSDLGGALVFVAAAIGLIVAAITGAVLVALTAFPQPYFTLLVVGMAFLAMGLVLHFLREPLSPPPKTPVSPMADPNAYSRATALQRQHDEKAREKEAREEVANLRRATRRIREELLDNKHVVGRIPLNLDELLALHFDSWRTEKTALLDQEDPKPHEMASAAYRELRGLLRGRVSDNDLDGSPYTYGEPPSQRELNSAEQAVDRAVETLV
jgi:hypothetical protein